MDAVEPKSLVEPLDAANKTSLADGYRGRRRRHGRARQPNRCAWA
jgi:hypothetical protein